MKKIHSLDELKAEILSLEKTRDQQEERLKTVFHETMESMRLSSILKKTAKDLANSSEFKNDLVNAGMSLTAGYLSKRITFGKSGSLVKWLFGNMLQMGVTNLVAKNADTIKSTGMNFIQSLFRKKKDDTNTGTDTRRVEEPVEQSDGN
ncbi:MAG TPA: hypothetical protein VD905_02465 [Flavobacteriales bacterium]|nr:hypothetical protein [Flavobacteriales bacterium]